MENKRKLNKEEGWLDRDVKRFKKYGDFIPKNQQKLYKKIRDHWGLGRTVVDLGCSAGWGSNILSHNARHVWGLDFNERAVEFADHMFSRPNLEFDIFDLENPPSRPISPMEVVVMIEVLEHLPDYKKGLNTMKTFFNDKLQTVGFITAPNINHPRVGPADAENPLHFSHWTPGEFYELMTKHFKHVTLFGSKLIDQWVSEETVDGSDVGNRIIVAKVEGAK